MRNKSFLSGAFVLGVAGVVCKVLGAFYRVPLANILGEVGMGVYQLIYPIYAFSIVFVTSGLTNAIAYLVSANKKNYSKRSLKRFFYAGLIASSIFCLLITLLFLIFNKQLAGLLGNQNAYLGLIIAGVSAGLSGVVCSIRGWFQGLENMTPTAVSQVVEQVLKVGVGIWLAIKLSASGVVYSVAGAFAGVLAGELFASLYLVIRLIARKKTRKYTKTESELKFSQAFSLLFRKWFAFGLAGLVIPLMVALDSFLVVNLLQRAGFGVENSTAMFGILSGMVNSLINFPIVLAVALSTAVIPSITSSFKQNKMSVVQDKANLSIKLVLILCLPCAVGFMLIADNILAVFYPTLTPVMHGVATRLLLISAVNVVYLGLLQITTSILQSLGHQIIPVISAVVGCFFKFALTLILVPNPSVNIYGSAIAGVFGYLVPTLINIIALKREIKVGLGAKFGLVQLLALGLMTVSTWVTNMVLSRSLSPIFVIFMCVFVACVSYFAVLNAFKQIKLDLSRRKRLTS